MDSEGAFISKKETYYYRKSILISMGFKPMKYCLVLGNTDSEGAFISKKETYYYSKSILILIGFKPMKYCLVLGNRQ